jgi:PAS domain S-box-containing protein
MNIKDLFLRWKISASVIVIVAVGIILTILLNTDKSRRILLNEVEWTTLPAYRDTVLNALTTMMMTGSIKESKRPFVEQMKHIADLRIIRAERLDKVYGKGGPDDYANDDIEKEVIQTGAERVVIQGEYVRGVYPYIAKSDFMGKNCLRCHAVSEGTILGAISIKIPLAALFAKIRSLRNLYFGFGLMVLLSVAIATILVEEALNTREQKYRELFDSTLDGIFQVNAGGIFTRMNKAGAKIFGHETPDEMIGRPALDYWREPRDRAAYREELSRKKIVSAYPMKAMTKNGEPIELESSSRVLEDIHGAFLGIEGILRDVTERKRTEEALQKSERFLRETQLVAGLGTYNVDLTTGQWLSSDILDDIFGIDKKFDRSVAAWASLIHPDDRQMIMNYFTYDVVGLHHRFDREYRIIRNEDGTVRWVHGLGRLEFNADDKPVRMIGTIQDITQRKTVDSELSDARSKIKILSGMLPICSSCKKIRDDQGYWSQLETYVSDHSEAAFSHGICPECALKLYPEYYDKLFPNGQDNNSKSSS